MDTNIEILFGAALIVIYAFERFNTPSSVRASTTAGRYYMAIFLYLLIYLVTFLVFTYYPGIAGGLKKQLVANDINVDWVLAGFFDPNDSKIIFVALVLSLLVPKMPVMSKIDKKIREFLHKLALIPYEAIRRSRDMQAMDFEIPESDREKLENDLESLGFKSGKIDTNTQDALARGGLNIVHLITSIKGWEGESRFSSFMQDRSDQYNRLKEHCKRYVSMMQNLVELDEQIGVNPDIGVLHETRNNFRSNMQVEREALYADICDFISHAVLTCCLTNGNIKKVTKDLGFICDPNRISKLVQTVNYTLTLFSLLLVFVLISFILLLGTNGDIERILLIVTMIVSIYSAAVVCALFPKQIWLLFKYKNQVYPVCGYFLSGLMAMSSSLVISMFFKTLVFAKEESVTGIMAPFTLAWNDFTTVSYPWIIMSFVAAVSTAFLSDWTLLNNASTYIRRSLDAVLQSIILIGGSVIVYLWLVDLEHTRVPDLTRLMIITGGIGFLIGFIVPSWYRSSYVTGPDHKVDERITGSSTQIKVQVT
jgi:hypothetical protein